MNCYYALAILAVLAGAFAQNDPTPSCSKQMELEHRCMLNVETSPEAQMIKDRLKQAKKTCVPDYPAECHAQFEAGHECAMQIAKNADSDSVLQKAKSESQPAVDACFDKYPVNIKEGVMEIFMMGKPMHHRGHKKHHGGHHKRHHNETSASGEASASGENVSVESVSLESNSNETSSERHHGGRRHGGGSSSGGKSGEGRHHGGKHQGRCRGHRHHRHHGSRNATSGESNSNETSASHSGERRHHRGGKSGSGESGEKSQCRKTEEQKQCIKTEMAKLAKDAAFVDVINTLIHQKQKCKQIVTWSCSPKCHKKKKCVFEATKPCRQAFMDKMKTCLADKGFTLPPFMLKEHTHIFTTPAPDTTQ